MAQVVNNKGQSVLSLAASHLSEETIEQIRKADQAEGGEWRNFRQTNSDGMKYGDRDPRFVSEDGSDIDVQNPPPPSLPYVMAAGHRC